MANDEAPPRRRIQLEPTPLGVVSSAPTWKSARDRIIEAANGIQVVADRKREEKQLQETTFAQEGIRELAKMIGCELSELDGSVVQSDLVTLTCTIGIGPGNDALRLKGRRYAGSAGWVWDWFVPGHEAGVDAIKSLASLANAIVRYKLKLGEKQYGE